MISRILKQFHRRPKRVEPRPNANEYEADGLNCAWLNWDQRRVSGFTRPRPVVGDVLFAKMESGRTALFVFVEVDHMHDVHDQYFATVKELG